MTKPKENRVADSCNAVFMRSEANGLKEVLGMRVGKSESSSFWMGVLTDLSTWSSGYIDYLYDNLNGFTDTIRTVSPQSST